MKKIITYIKTNWKFLLTLVLVSFICLYELPFEVYGPGGKIDLSNKYENELYETKGSFNVTYVSSYPGTLPILAISYIMPNWDIIKNDDIKYDNETIEEAYLRNKILNDSANTNSIYVAYKKAGFDVNITNKKIYVTYIHESAKTDLKIGDIVLEADNNKFNNHDELVEYIKSKNIDDKIEFTVLRDNKEIKCYGILSDISGYTLIGIGFNVIYEYDNNPNIEYKSEKNEYGPSGGLMMTLYIYNSLIEEDISKGYTIAGTGTIDLNGNVGGIDGVKYKLIGAYKKGAKVFIVPEENYEEALKVKQDNKYDIELISVTTFDDALNKLKELK